MRIKPLFAYLALLALAGLAGLAHRELYGLYHWGSAQWVKAISSLLVLPLDKLLLFAPGIAVGYFFSGARHLPIFAIGSLAWLPYQYMAGARLESGAITLLASAMAYGVATLVAFLAGCRLSRG